MKINTWISLPFYIIKACLIEKIICMDLTSTSCYSNLCFYCKHTRGRFHQHFTHNFFCQYFWAKKLQSQNVTLEKLREALSYTKSGRNMLVKLSNSSTFYKQLLLRCSCAKKLQSQTVTRENLHLKCWLNWL